MELNVVNEVVSLPGKGRTSGLNDTSKAEIGPTVGKGYPLSASHFNIVPIRVLLSKHPYILYLYNYGYPPTVPILEGQPFFRMLSTHIMLAINHFL